MYYKDASEGLLPHLLNTETGKRNGGDELLIYIEFNVWNTKEIKIAYHKMTNRDFLCVSI
jgi:hypothetical protein